MLVSDSVTHSNPYPGLRPYQATEQTQFYGRDTDTQALLEKILANRLTLLFAATGVGKSSLLQAAILPKLSSTEGLALDVVYYNDWVASPVQGLQAAIRAALISRYGALPNTDNANLEAFFRAITPNTSHPLVIILDQFEEFFRYRFIHHAADFQPFIDQLTEVILAAELKVSLVFSMREDFALELNAFKPHLPNPLFSNYYRLEKLGVDAARAAITEPLIQAGYQYEPALLDKLLTDLLSRDLTRDAASLAKGTQADSVEPPYLQIVCSQLWELDKNDPQKTLRLATYNKAGGAKGLLENYVNFVMKSFSDREKQVASKAFDHLISRRGTKMAHTPEDLAELVNLKPAELANVMDKLEKARILRRQQRDSQVWYELYHDMFSGGIESWNTVWKNHMRVRRTLIGTGASLAALAVIYFSLVAYLQSTSKHLRLGSGNEDRVEIYTGTSKFPDPFGQQHYFRETEFEREALELDKRYARRDIPDYPLVVRDLISSQPLDTRVGLYIENGELCQYSDLLTQAMPLETPAPHCPVNTSRKRSTATLRKPVAANAEAATSLPENDPMLQPLLTRLTELKIPWGLEQIKKIAQLYPQSIWAPNALGYYHTLDKNKLFNDGLEAGYSGDIRDPYQLELLVDWALDPTRMTPAQPRRPKDIVTSLVSSIPLPLMVPVLQSMQLKPRIVAALQGNDAEQQEVAIALSTVLRDPDFFEPLNQLAQAKMASTRQAALESLILIDVERAIPIVTPFLKDRTQSSDLRNMLISTLGSRDSLNAVPLLLERFKDVSEREELRQQAGEWLGKLGNTRVIPELRAVLSDLNERSEARIGAIEGLKSLNDQASIALLLERMNDAEERLAVRDKCASVLGELSADQASQSLLALIETPSVDQSLKMTAVGAVTKLDDPSIAPRLLAYWGTLPKNGFLASETQLTLSNLNNPDIDKVLNAGLSASISTISSEKSRLQSFSQERTILPHYVAKNPISPIITVYSVKPDTLVPLDYLDSFYGSYQQKQTLITALMLKGSERNLALIALALDETTSVNLRSVALGEMLDEGITPKVIEALQKLTQHPKHLIRTQSISTLLRTASGQELLPWLKEGVVPLSPSEELTALEQALARLATTSPRSEAIATLLNFAQDDTSLLQAKAYQLLGDLKAMEALPLLQTNLAALEQEYERWRTLRDQQPEDTADEASYNTWQQQFSAATPAHGRLAAHYGYALAQMSAQQALAMLEHDLADIRLGASWAFNKVATVSELQALAQVRAERTQDPLFQQASYTALDKALTRLEDTEDAAELTALETWKTQLTNANDLISQRLYWTLTTIKQAQQIDQEYAQKYQLKPGRLYR